MDFLRDELPESTWADLELLRAWEGEGVEDPEIEPVSARVDAVAVPLGFRDREVASLINSVTSFNLSQLRQPVPNTDTWERSDAATHLDYAREILEFEEAMTPNRPGMQWWSDTARPVAWETRELTLESWRFEIAFLQACVAGTDGTFRYGVGQPEPPTPPAGSLQGSSLS